MKAPLDPLGNQNGDLFGGLNVDTPRVPITNPPTVSNIKQKDDRISFDVSEIGKPVLVKASYFPNWQASGASGVWRVTPNEMVVIPTSTHVSLHYGWTPVDWFGNFATLLGLLGLIVLWRRSPSGDDEGVDEPPVAEPVVFEDADEDWLKQLASVGPPT